MAPLRSLRDLEAAKAAAYAATVATALLAFAPLALFADSFDFKGQTVEFENAALQRKGGSHVCIDGQ